MRLRTATLQEYDFRWFAQCYLLIKTVKFHFHEVFEQRNRPLCVQMAHMRVMGLSFSRTYLYMISIQSIYQIDDQSYNVMLL
jgi:hypothetical protein